MIETLLRYLVRDLVKRLLIYALAGAAVTYCVWQGYQGIAGWKAGMANLHGRNAAIEAKFGIGG